MNPDMPQIPCKGCGILMNAYFFNKRKWRGPKRTFHSRGCFTDYRRKNPLPSRKGMKYTQKFYKSLDDKEKNLKEYLDKIGA